MEHDSDIRITVHISGHLRKFVSSDREVLLPRSATVRHLLNVLADASPDLRAVLFKPSGELNAQVLLFVDDEQSHAGHELSSAKSVTLMLPISGG